MCTCVCRNTYMYTLTFIYTWLWDQGRASGVCCLPLLLSALFFETVKVKFTVQARLGGQQAPGIQLSPLTTLRSLAWAAVPSFYRVLEYKVGPLLQQAAEPLPQPLIIPSQNRIKSFNRRKLSSADHRLLQGAACYSRLPG